MYYSEALKVLELESVLNSRSAAKNQVKAQYHKLAQELHPDKGGNPAAFDRLNQAYRVALRYLVTAKFPCNACDGTGKITITANFYTIQRRCKTCHGRGSKE